MMIVTEIALFQFEPDVGQIETVLDCDRDIVGQPQALQLPDRFVAQLFES